LHFLYLFRFLSYQGVELVFEAVCPFSMIINFLEFSKRERRFFGEFFCSISPSQKSVKVSGNFFKLQKILRNPLTNTGNFFIFDVGIGGICFRASV